jgi:hypothetical protein
VELLLLGGIAAVALAIIVGACAAIAFVFRALLWIILFPIKLAIGLLVGIVVFPIVAVAGFIAMVAIGAVMIVPLLPLLALGAVVWLLVKATKPALA